MMKIARVETIPLAAKTDRPIRMPAAVVDTFYATLVRIHADNGLSGIGECIVRKSPRTTASLVDDLLAPVLLGRDLMDVEGLWQDMFRIMRGRGHSKGFLVEAMSGVDTALWDLLGKFHRLPFGKLLGGCGRASVPAYASSVMLNDIAVMERNAAALVEEGYRTVKVKVGFGVNRDIDNIRRIRKTVGPDVALFVDANSAYDAGDAVRAGRGFEEQGVLWFEEPVPPDDLDGYARIRDRLDMKITAGESEFTLYGFRPLFERGCIDVVQPDVARAGGVSECRRIAQLADAFGKSYSPHTGFSSSVCVLASLQLASWAPNLAGAGYEHMVLDNPLQRLMQIDPPKPVNGVIAVPQAPGLGAEPDEEIMKRYRLD